MSITKMNYAPKRLASADIGISSLQEFRDRTIKSRTWPTILPYVDLSFCNLSTLLHMNELFATIETCVFLVFQLKSNASSHYRTSGLKTIGHRYVFGEVLPSFSFASASFEVAEAVFDILVVAQILILLAFAYLVYRVKNEPIRKSDGSKTISWMLSQVLVIKNSLALGPIAEVATLVIKNSNIPFLKALGVISLLLLPIETLVHCCLTYDYGFITANKIQGRVYSFFFLRSTGLIFLTVLRTSWEGHRTDQSDLLINLLSFVLSFALVYIQIVHNTYYWSPFLEKVSTVALSFYCWECFTILLLTLWPEVISDFDLDYLTVVMMPLIFWGERNLLATHRQRVGNLGSHLGHKTAADGVFYLELLYGAFKNFKEEENAFMVGSSLSRHTLACKDPLCLCFFLRSNVDINSGFDAGRSARELAHKALFTDKKNSAELKEGAVEASGFGKLCTIGLPDVISTYKSRHFKVASVEINKERSSIKVTESEYNTDSDKMNFVLTLQDPPSYLATILGFFRSLIGDHAKGHNLDAVIGFLRFAIGEYGSCICALLVLYEYIYSADYNRHTSTTADFLLINLMQQAKRKLAEEDSENRPALEGRTLTQIISLRKRVQNVVKKTMEGIHNKREMYEELVSQRADAESAYDIGQTQQANQNFLEGEYNELLAHKVPNIELLKSAIHFQMFHLEKKSTPRSLLKRFKELTQDYLHRTTYDPVDGIPVLRHASPYASDHVIVFTRFTNNSYRISHLTDNAQELFCSESRELLGRKISDFMPKEIADSHDCIVNSYLNGQSKSKFEADIPTVLITDNGDAKSITLIPRVESIFTEEVYIAGLIQNRNQLALSTTVTSLAGRVQKIGRSTSHFEWTLKEKETIFKVVPGLFHALYPSSKSSFSKRIKQAEERVNESTTLRPPDFEKSMIDPSTRSHNEIGDSAHNHDIQRGQSFEQKLFVEEALTGPLGATSDPQAPDVQPGQTVTTLTEVFMYCFYDGVPSSAAIDDLKQSNMLYSTERHKQSSFGLKGSSSEFRLLAEHDLEKVCRTLQQDKLNFARNLEYTQKVCLKIDTHYYQADLSIREVSVLKSEKAGPRHFLFFQTLVARIPKMIGFLASVSPETVEELNRFWLHSKKNRLGLGTNSKQPQELTAEASSPKRNKQSLGLKLQGQNQPKGNAAPGSVKIPIPPLRTNQKATPQIFVQKDPVEGSVTDVDLEFAGTDRIDNSGRETRPKGGLIPNSDDPSVVVESDDGISKVVHQDLSESPRDRDVHNHQDVFGEKKPGPQKLLLKTRTDGGDHMTLRAQPSLGSGAMRFDGTQQREDLRLELNKISEVEIPRELLDYLALIMNDIRSSDDRIAAKIESYAQELDVNAEKAGSSQVEDLQEIRMDVRMRAGKHPDGKQEGNKTVKYSRDTEQRTEKQLEELRKLEEMDIQVTSNMISTVRSRNTQHYELKHIRKVMKLRLNSVGSHFSFRMLYMVGVLSIVCSIVLLHITAPQMIKAETALTGSVEFLGGLILPLSKIFKISSEASAVDGLQVAGHLDSREKIISSQKLGQLSLLSSSLKRTLLDYANYSNLISRSLSTNDARYRDLKYYQNLISQSYLQELSRFAYSSELHDNFYLLLYEIRVLDLSGVATDQEIAPLLQRLSLMLLATTYADIRSLQASGAFDRRNTEWMILSFMLVSFCILFCITLVASCMFQTKQARLIEVMQHVDYGKCEDSRVRLTKALNYLNSIEADDQDMEERVREMEEVMRKRTLNKTNNDWLMGSAIPKDTPNEEPSKISPDLQLPQEEDGIQTTQGPLLTEGYHQGEISFMKGGPLRNEAVEISIAPLESPKKDKPRTRLGRDGSQKNLQGSWLSSATKKQRAHSKSSKEKKKRIKSGPVDKQVKRKRTFWEYVLFLGIWTLAYTPLLAGYLTYRSERLSMEQKLWAASVLYTDAAHLQETIAWQYLSIHETLKQIDNPLVDPKIRTEILALQAFDFEDFGKNLGRYINGDLIALSGELRSKVICDSPVYSDAERATCTSIISNYRETLYDGVQQYLYSSKLTFQNKTSEDVAGQGSSLQATRSIDMASDYFSQAFIEVAKKTLATVDTDMSSEGTLLSSLGYVFVLLVAVVLLLHRWCWVPNSTEKFRKIFSTLLVLNDDILMNPYLMQFLVASSNSLMMK